MGERGLPKGRGELQGTSTGLHQPSFLAFCLFNAHGAGSMMQGDTNPDVVMGREEEKIKIKANE